MSLPDTAEYWDDVKRNYPRVGVEFRHIPNAECGHRHWHDAKRLGDVTCYACIKLIEAGHEHNLPAGETLSRSEKKRRAYVKEREELYGRCECGRLMTPRKNTTTGIKFLGCEGYPKCKCTRRFGNLSSTKNI